MRLRRLSATKLRQRSFGSEGRRQQPTAKAAAPRFASFAGKVFVEEGFVTARGSFPKGFVPEGSGNEAFRQRSLPVAKLPCGVQRGGLRRRSVAREGVRFRKSSLPQGVRCRSQCYREALAPMGLLLERFPLRPEVASSAELCVDRLSSLETPCTLKYQVLARAGPCVSRVHPKAKGTRTRPGSRT